MSLKTDYKDDILATGNLRKYQMINNSDGTVSFQDVTVYEQTGDIFGAGDINKTNQAVNEKFDSDDVVDPMETTEHGFAADALAVKNQFNEQNKNLSDLEEALKWKLVGTATGTTAIALPSEFNELLVETKNDNLWYNTTTNIPKCLLSASDKRYIAGGSSSGGQLFVRIVANIAKIYLENCVAAGGDITASTITSVYCR